MTKKLFLAISPVAYDDDPPGTAHRQTMKDPHRHIHRIVAAPDEATAIIMIEEHIQSHGLLMDDEHIAMTEANEALGMS